MSYKLTGKLFGKKEEEEFYSEISKFKSVDDVCLTEKLVELLGIVIEHVFTKNRWLDPKGTFNQCEDLSQEIYVQCPRQLRNIWKRHNDPSNPIQKLYSYLFRSIQNMCWNSIRKEQKYLGKTMVLEKKKNQESGEIDVTHFYGLEYTPDIATLMDKQESQELWGSSIPDIYSSLSHDDLVQVLDNLVDTLELPFEGREFLAAKHLCEAFKHNLVIELEDLEYFLEELPADRCTIIFCKMDALLKYIVYQFEQQVLLDDGEYTDEFFRSHLRCL